MYIYIRSIYSDSFHSFYVVFIVLWIRVWWDIGFKVEFGGARWVKKQE